jgi:hypothetical protein
MHILVLFSFSKMGYNLFYFNDFEICFHSNKNERHEKFTTFT